MGKVTRLGLGVARALLAGSLGLALVKDWAGCLPHSCTDMGCIGRAVRVALVDEQGVAVAARGEVDFEHHSRSSFDCTITPDAQRDDIDCEDAVLQLEPIYNQRDTLQLRFQLADGSFTEWQAVELTVQREVLRDFNGPDCDCEVLHATAAPVVVPEAARQP